MLFPSASALAFRLRSGAGLSLCSLLVLLVACGGSSSMRATPPPPPPQPVCATPANSNPAGGGGIYSQISIDPAVYAGRAIRQA